MTCAHCQHRFSFPECLAVWFPSRVPCPACRGLCSLGLRGWSAFAALNLVGVAALVWAFLQCAAGAMAPHRGLAFVLLVSALTPFVWFGALRFLPARPAGLDP